jgi:hypothetical protein
MDEFNVGYSDTTDSCRSTLELPVLSPIDTYSAV